MQSLVENYMYYLVLMSEAKTIEEYRKYLKERNWYLDELTKYGYPTETLPTSPVVDVTNGVPQ